MRLSQRLMKLEQSRPQQQFCWPLDYFYGEAVAPMPLIRNLSLTAFYNRLSKEVQHG